MKTDERNLMWAIMHRGPRSLYPLINPHAKTARELAEEIGIHPKRACRIFEKWSGKDWYEYGVAVDLGWLTPIGEHYIMHIEPANRSKP